MKCVLFAAAAIFCGVQANAATVSLSQNEELRIELTSVSGAGFDFALPDDYSGFVNYGGYLKWSTRADGRQDGDGPWGDCLECGYWGGSWDLASTGQSQKLVTLDFGNTLQTVYVWIRSTYGSGSVTYDEAVQPSSPNPSTPAPVPLPAPALLLAAALGGLGMVRLRSRSKLRT